MIRERSDPFSSPSKRTRRVTKILIQVSGPFLAFLDVRWTTRSVGIKGLVHFIDIPPHIVPPLKSRISPTLWEGFLRSDFSSLDFLLRAIRYSWTSSSLAILSCNFWILSIIFASKSGLPN